MKGIHVDKLFLGADGFTFTNGITTSNVLEVEVERKMVEAANEVILVADSSKIGVKGLISIIPLNCVHKLFTDTGAPPEFVAQAREQGLNVILV